MAPRITISTPIIIDGNLSKPVWQNAPWSDLFDDIRGPNDAPQDDRPPSSCETRFKMIYDENFLYIGALLHADSDHPVVTTFTKRNEPIFQQDSDFEVFIDPTSTTHNYKEFEVNAFNTVWNLVLDKPYIDGGQEHSGRVAEPGQDLYYDVTRQQSAVQILHGTVNSPSDTVWSVEIAMAFSDLLHVTTRDKQNQAVSQHHLSSSKSVSSSPPQPSPLHFWRINFSRVERKGALNWTWQPQIEWNPQEKRYQGNVNMHLPNAWGYLIFGPLVNNYHHDRSTMIDSSSTPHDPSWPIRMAAMNIYSAQHAFFLKSKCNKDNNNNNNNIYSEDNSTTAPHHDDSTTSLSQGQYASHFKDLEEWLDMELMTHVVSHVELDLPPTKTTFSATLYSRQGVYLATIREDRFLQVVENDSMGGTLQ